jgi:hypothetical protein
MPKIQWRSFLPHLAAVAIFLVLIFAYFPELLDNKSLRMDDIEQHKGMSNELADYRERTGEEAIWTNAMFGGMPGYIISVVYHGNLLQYGAQIMKLGLPRPADSMFVLMLGMYFLLLVFRVRPPLAIIGAAAYCFTTYNLLIMEAGHMSKVDAISWMPWVLAGVVMALQGKYLVGGLITAIFLSIQVKASHFQVTYYMAFILMFFAIFYLIDAVRNKTLPSFAKSAVVLVIAAVLGVLTNISSLYTIYDYGKDSIRGKSELTIKDKQDGDGLDADYALQYSYGVGETFSYFIPNVYGGASNLGLADQKDALNEATGQYKSVIQNLPQYWWNTSTTGPFYAGAIVCFLAVLGFFFVEGPKRWAILASCIIAILLSWGRNFESFSLFMLDYFPGYNKFRAVKMMLIIVDFMLPLMAILGLNEIVKNPERLTSERWKFFASIGLTGGLALVFYLVPDMFFSFDYLNPQIADQVKNMLSQGGYGDAEMSNWMAGFMSDLQDVRIAIFKADAIRAFLLVAAAAGVIFAYAKMKFNPIVLSVIVLVLTIGDLWSVDKRYVNKKDFIASSRLEIPFSPSAADEAIYSSEIKMNPGLQQKIDNYKQEVQSRKKKSGQGAANEAKNRFRGLLANTDYRVLNAASDMFNDAGTSFFHKSVGGYSAAKLERYQEFIEFQLQPSIQNIFGAFNSNPSDSSLNEMLSQQYALNMLNTKYIIYNQKAPPLSNKYALGNAWFVSNLQEVPSADEEIKALKPGFNPAETAIVDVRFHDDWAAWKHTSDSSASIIQTSYAPNALTYKSNSSVEQIAVFSEIYYAKGWKAFIDGTEVPHFRVNYILRAMKVPAGKHTIEFKFDPEVYHTTEAIAKASSGFLILLILVLLGLQFKKKREEEPKQA